MCREPIPIATVVCGYCGERQGAVAVGPGPVPPLLRVWGLGILSLHGLWLAATLATAVGWGLSRGQRSAVFGAAVLGGLSLLAGLALVLLGAIGKGGNEPLWVGLIVCAIAAAVWAPPLVVGWRRRAEL